MTKIEMCGKLDVKSGKTDKDRSSKRSQKREKQKPQTKIVIRHLPPTMSEVEFLKQIDPLPPHDFYYFAVADWSLGYDATCRAYITMKNYDDVFVFRDRFDGYVFVDSKGAEYPAIVEFAPFQGLVKNKSRRIDNKVNTIEQETHYQQFISKLEEEREAAKSECKLEFNLDRKKEEKITSTPLLQYLANKKEKRREEAKRRQEEKRRQREEDKQRKQTQPQVTKIVSNHETGVNGLKNSSKSASGKENIGADKGTQPQQHEEGKSTRSQRRAERNQRRREEFERRRQEREQRDKGGDIKTKLNNESEAKESEKKMKEQANPSNKSDDGKQQQQQRKDGGKRYSERRERERNRNRKEKDNQKNVAVTEITKTEVLPETDSKTTENTHMESGAEAIVSESVMNFIRTVATAKEFVPKHKQHEMGDVQKKATEETKTELNGKQETDRKTSSEEPKKVESNSENDTRPQNQRVSDEQRRIRNKDRPSIAIYQPKPRLRVSEERDTSSSRPQVVKTDVRSNPTSDCESLKKEETRSKKVSRYSERRAERRNNSEKKKPCTDSIETEQKREHPKSNTDENCVASNLNIASAEMPEKQTDQVNVIQNSD